MGLSSSFGGADLGQIGAFPGAFDFFNGLLDRLTDPYDLWTIFGAGAGNLNGDS